MSEQTVSIAIWNVEWRKARSRNADILRNRIFEKQPDIICLTEAYTNFLPDFGYRIEADPDYGYPKTDGRRKVILWSKQPWQDVDQIGDSELPTGRFVSATSSTPIGQLDVIGVCMPWHSAHVTTGQKDRQRWDDHLSYLSGLRRVLDKRTRRTVVVGDYNQTIPKTRAPQRVYNSLYNTILNRLSVPTVGRIAPLDILAIDHLSHTNDLHAKSVTGLSNLDAQGREISDHFGLHIILENGSSLGTPEARIGSV